MTTGAAEASTGVVTGVRREGTDVVVTCAGEFDVSCADTIFSAGREHLAPGLGSLTLDLVGVTLLDSRGIAAVLRLHRAAAQIGVPVRLLLRHGLVLQVLEITGVTGYLTVEVAAA